MRFGRARRGGAGLGRPGVEGQRTASQGTAVAGMERQMSDRTDSISKELLALKNDNGVINPTEVVRWAEGNPKSHLHASLEWDDGVAAERWRVSQVRQLIAVHIVEADGGRRFVSLSIDRRHDGSNGYRELADVIGQPNLREIMLHDALKELERIQERYKRLSELAPVWEAADQTRAKRNRKAAA